jgi:hypothetical protein
MKEYEQKIHNIINNAEEDVIFQAHQAYKQGYEDGKADTPFTDTEEVENKAYNRGLNEAWEATMKIIEPVYNGGYDYDALHEIFGVSTIRPIFNHNTAAEAIAKIKAYEDKQEQFATGDEVRGIDSGKRAVILDKKYGLYRALAFDGIIHEGTEEAFTKTGRTFPQIAEVLKELRGAENDE